MGVYVLFGGGQGGHRVTPCTLSARGWRILPVAFFIVDTIVAMFPV